MERPIETRKQFIQTNPDATPNPMMSSHNPSNQLTDPSSCVLVEGAQQNETAEDVPKQTEHQTTQPTYLSTWSWPAVRESKQFASNKYQREIDVSFLC